MRAVGYRTSLPVTDPECLVDITVADPEPSGHDLLVEVQAVSVNPVDTKVRAAGGAPDGQWRILGWDASGVVRAVGGSVRLFAPGDEVWYAGDLTRPGTNAQLHLVDERIVAHKPRSLDFTRAAALPLTSITAWELLFDRLGVQPGPDAGAGEALLIIGAGGGVGSILTQFARRLTGLTVIGTASRPQTREWVAGHGAHHVIDHSQPLVDQLRDIGVAEVSYVASLTHTDAHFDQIVDVLAPQGRFGLIDDPAPGSLDITRLKRKSISVHWEFMFTRSMFGTADMIVQHELLAEVARLVDDDVLVSTATDDLGPVNAANLIRAHAILESGQARGKMVLTGF